MEALIFPWITELFTATVMYFVVRFVALRFVTRPKAALIAAALPLSLALFITLMLGERGALVVMGLWVAPTIWLVADLKSVPSKG